MNTKFLSNRAMSVIEQYSNFKVANATCSVPYFNNKTTKNRLALRAFVGKGSPRDIHEEVQSLILKSRIDDKQLTDQTLKKILVDNNLGIDCSGFVYYILNAESQEMNRGSIDKHISFIKCSGLVGKIKCSLRPAENCDVETLSSDKNSTEIKTLDIKPGDIITMTSGPEGAERDHVLIVHSVDYQNFTPLSLKYSHAVAYPEDGIYGTGIKQGKIDIIDPNKNITEQVWYENDKTGSANVIFQRALKSKTSLRRMNSM